MEAQVVAVLGNLAVEVAFPACGLCCLKDCFVNLNENTFKTMREVESFKWETCRRLVAGSKAEGLAMQPGWGHGSADIDLMFLWAEGMVVGVAAPGQRPPESANLTFRSEGCPPAYARLEILNKDRLVQAIRKSCHWSMPDKEIKQCVSRGRWLQSRKLLDAMRLPLASTVQGPAAGWGSDLVDHVTSLVCSGQHPAMLDYSRRPRTHWPSQTEIDVLLRLPMILVCVAPRGHRDAGELFRVSWSPQEMKLFQGLVFWTKQGYVCFKYTVKFHLAALRCQGDNSPSWMDSIKSTMNSFLASWLQSDDGRSKVGSFHLKTVFLRHLEEHPPQPNGSPFQLVLDLCRDLRWYLEKGRLPHYFLPDCDLLQTVGKSERQYAIRAVDAVLEDPIKAIIHSPVDKQQIFGDRLDPEGLACSFLELSQQPTCQSRREDLERRLHDLDKYREGRYRARVEEDEVSYRRVSGRPGLVGLADYLRRITLT